MRLDNTTVAHDQHHRPRLPAITLPPKERRDGPRSLSELADRMERARRDAVPSGAEVDTDVALAVVLVGVACSVVGWWIAPVSQRSDVAESSYALVISTLFWMSALIAAIGLYFRMRRGLLAALVCAMSFLAAVAIDAMLDSSVIGARWAGELGCAGVFWLACLGALMISDRKQSARDPRRSARRSAHRRHA